MDENHQKALASLNTALRGNCTLPENVFRQGWKDFRFFDSDWIFEGPFVSKVQALLEAEVSSCAVLRQLSLSAESVGATFFVDKNSREEDFAKFIRGTEVGNGWLYDFGSFGCSSDRGNWAIYCERGSEIAIIAVKEKAMLSKIEGVTASLRAAPFEEAVALPLSYGFSPKALSEQWRERMILSYRSF